MHRSACYPLLVLLLMTARVSARPGKVYIFPTLHRLHQNHVAYSYDSLRTAISRINPDVIAVEIRPEDIGGDTGYLRRNYPYEMWMMRYWFPKAQIAGIDWLGEDIAAKPIPVNYWNETARIKKMERALQADSEMTARVSVCNTAFPERLHFLKTLSLSQLQSSAYGQLTEQFYACLEGKLRKTRYQYIPAFYKRRNSLLAQNARRIVRGHPGKTIVILTGADHYCYIKNALSQAGIEIALLIP